MYRTVTMTVEMACRRDCGNPGQTRAHKEACLDRVEAEGGASRPRRHSHDRAWRCSESVTARPNNSDHPTVTLSTVYPSRQPTVSESRSNGGAAAAGASVRATAVLPEILPCRKGTSPRTGSENRGANPCDEMELDFVPPVEYVSCSRSIGINAQSEIQVSKRTQRPSI
jgi:hypothetical protein